MKLMLCFVLIFLTFVAAAFVPESFAQTTTPQNMVRLIYFVPRDRTPQPDINTKLDKLIKEAQQIFAGQMEHYGFGRKTFQFETDGAGRAVVHHVKGKFRDEYYHTQSGKVWDEIDKYFDTSTNIYLAALDTSTEDLDGFACGYGGPYGTYGGTVLIPASGWCFEEIDVTVHELGHAFGLLHDFRNNLKPWIDLYSTEPMTTSLCAAEWLDANRYFNNHQTYFDEPTTIEDRSDNKSLRFKITDSDGLHQAQLFTTVEYLGGHDLGIIDCKSLDGSSNIVEFVLTPLTLTADSKPLKVITDSVTLKVIDALGNFVSQKFPINIASLRPPSKAVSIPDANLAAAIRDALGFTSKRSITQLDMLGLRIFFAHSRNITNLKGLEYAKNLRYLHLQSNQISDFTPIAELTNLVELNLSLNPCSDLMPLTGLTQLKDLYLWNNEIQDITSLEGLAKLRSLHIQRNQISDVSPLTSLTQLEFVYLSNNQISDIRPLTGLVALRRLELRHNPILNGSMLGTLLEKNLDLKLDIDIAQGVSVMPVRVSKPPTMYWIDTKNGTLHRTVGNKVKNFLPSVRNATSLAVDLANSKLYWTERTGKRSGSIQRSKLNGSNAELLKEPTSVPIDITLDAASGKLYLINSFGKIQRLNVDGTGFEPNFIRGLKSPTEIALDVAGGKVYWTERAGRIRRANLHGDPEIETVLTDLGALGGIAVVGRKLYWTEQMDKNTSKLQRSNLAGGDVETLTTIAGTLPSLNIDSTAGKVYWTNALGGVQRSNLDGENLQTLVTELTVPGDFALGVGATLALSTKSQVVVAADSGRPPMYWINRDTRTLHRLTGSTVEAIVPSVRHINNLAVDSANNKLYWSPTDLVVDMSKSKCYWAEMATDERGRTVSDARGRIRCANLDGSNVQFIKEFRGEPLAIALDTVVGKLYLTNYKWNAWGKIQRLNIDGSSFEPDFITDLKAPKAIALDVSGGKVYWTEYSNGIRCANLDGSNIQVVVEADLSASGSMALGGGKVYWTKKTGKYRGEILSANLNGDSNPEVLITLKSVPLDIAVDMTGRKLYWATTAGKLQRANLKGKNIRTVVTGLGRPVGLFLGSGSVDMEVASAPTVLLPSETTLLANFPNPFNPETWIPYALAKPADVTLTIYSINGQVVRTLGLGHQPAGMYQSRGRAAYWDGRNASGESVASGVYFYMLTTGDFSATRKMLIRK